MVLTTIALVVGIAILGYSLDSGSLKLDEEPGLAVELEQVSPSTGPDPVQFRVRPRIANLTDDPLELTAANPCKVFRWVLVDSAGEFIQSQPAEVCAEVVVTNRIEPGYQLEDEFLIELDPKRVTPGGQYQLMMQFWNHQAQTLLELD